MQKNSLTVLLCISFTLCNFMHTESTADQSSQHDAVQLVTELSEHLADLIIHHKSNVNDPEKTKECSVKIVKTLAEIIAEFIQKIKDRKTTKSVVLYDAATMDEIIEKITLEITQRVEASNL